jgi:hypothetical protein
MMGPGSDPYLLNPRAHRAFLEMMQEIATMGEQDPWRQERIQF